MFACRDSAAPVLWKGLHFTAHRDVFQTGWVYKSDNLPNSFESRSIATIQ